MHHSISKLSLFLEFISCKLDRKLSVSSPLHRGRELIKLIQMLSTILAFETFCSYFSLITVHKTSGNLRLLTVNRFLCANTSTLSCIKLYIADVGELERMQVEFGSKTEHVFFSYGCFQVVEILLISCFRVGRRSYSS